MMHKQSTGRTIDKRWYADAFGALYPIVYAHRTIASAQPEAHFACKQLHLTPQDSVLDLCCGNGRHMAHLYPRVAQLTGLDYSPHLLQYARENIGTHARLLRGDMRHLPFVQSFDAIVNFFTSFGYFMEDEDNYAVLHGIVRALRPGGRFFMDFLNAQQVQHTLTPHSEREQAEYRIIEDRWIDVEKQRVNKKTIVEKNGRSIAETGESVRLYTADTLIQILEQAGLAIDGLFGDYEGNAVGATRPRVLIVGHRKDRDG